VSVPIPGKNNPAATPAPVPELTRGQVAGSHGLRGTGYSLLSSGIPKANSMVEVLPVITAPAR